MFDIEAAAQALFELGSSIGSAPNTPTPLTTMSRRWVHFKDVPREIMPAFYQDQLPGFKVRNGQRNLPIYEFKFWWVCYLPGSESLTDEVSPLMNAYLKAFTAALAPGPGNRQQQQTLGGKVYNCYFDGVGLVDEGLLETPSLIALPITMLSGQ